MDRLIDWSPEAIEDLESIALYIERDSAFYARAVVTRILELIEMLPENPRIGRIVPERENDRLREMFVYSYRVIYHIEESILVVAIIHGKRDPNTIQSRLT